MGSPSGRINGTASSSGKMDRRQDLPQVGWTGVRSALRWDGQGMESPSGGMDRGQDRSQVGWTGYGTSLGHFISPHLQLFQIASQREAFLCFFKERLSYAMCSGAQSFMLRIPAFFYSHLLCFPRKATTGQTPSRVRGTCMQTREQPSFPRERLAADMESR